MYSLGNESQENKKKEIVPPYDFVFVTTFNTIKIDLIRVCVPNAKIEFSNLIPAKQLTAWFRMCYSTNRDDLVGNCKTSV